MLVHDKHLSTKVSFQLQVLESTFFWLIFNNCLSFISSMHSHALEWCFQRGSSPMKSPETLLKWCFSLKRSGLDPEILQVSHKVSAKSLGPGRDCAFSDTILEEEEGK